MKLLLTMIVLLALPALASELTLSWDAPGGFPAVTNYTVYGSPAFITNSINASITKQVTNSTALTVSNLNWNSTWYWVATSREGTNESDFSNQITNKTPKLPAPLNLRIVVP